MRKAITLILFFISFACFGQEAKLYNPNANASQEVAAAIIKAKAQGKFVLIQAGGNWCSWCIEFARFTKEDIKIDSVIKASFIVYHLNYNKENENKAMFAKLGYPQRFGFPVFIVLNAKGQRIHTQASEYLEDGKKSYSQQKVQSFLEMWSPRVLKPHMWGDK